MRVEYFFGFIISFIAGVAIEGVADFGYSFAVFFAILSIVIFLSHREQPQYKNVFLVSFVFLGCALGVLRVDVSQSNNDAHLLDKYTNEVVQVSGIVAEEPDVREAYTNIVLEARFLKDNGDSIVFDQAKNILIRVPVYPELRYGDEVSAIGKITKPKNFPAKDGSKSFDYESYLAKDDIYHQMYFPKISIIANNKGNVVVEKLFILKTWLTGNIIRMIPEPEASLAGGITLGTKQSMGDEILQKFRETGVAHIVVLSGYNIAVVAGIISRLVMFMPFTLRLITSAIGIILFAMMVGGGATVVRATIMALIIILARVLGREGDALRALVLAGGLMILANPMILLHDVSFQLSFSATLAIVTLVPTIEKYFTFIKSIVLREIIVTTFATQIFVLPLILYHMGSVSLIGLVANIFILPVVPLAMLVVALVAVFAWVPFVGSMFAFCSYFILTYIFVAVDFFARVPFASLHNISFSLAALVAVYAIFGLYIVKNSPSKIVDEKPEYEF